MKYLNQMEIKDIIRIHDSQYKGFDALHYELRMPYQRLGMLFTACHQLELIFGSDYRRFDFNDEKFDLWALFGYSPQYLIRYKSSQKRKKFEKKGINFSEIDRDDIDDD